MDTGCASFSQSVVGIITGFWKFNTSGPIPDPLAQRLGGPSPAPSLTGHPGGSDARGARDHLGEQDEVGPSSRDYTLWAQTPPTAARSMRAGPRPEGTGQDLAAQESWQLRSPWACRAAPTVTHSSYEITVSAHIKRKAKLTKCKILTRTT